MNKVNQARRDFLKTLGLGVASLALPGCSKAIAQIDSGYQGKKPNIVLIMADDLGYSDIGCFGGEIRTPNLDRLASGGMRFTQFYNSAKCSPTRASLLTGQYEHAVGVQNMEYGATFAEVLSTAGYRTIISGKWHQKPLPTTRGFDRYYGLADGCCNYWNPGIEARPGEPKPGRKRPAPRCWAIEGKAIMGYVPEDKNFYTTDAFTDYAIERLEEYKDENRPFLLYLPFTAPHYPLHAWPADIAKYRGKYKIGWDKLRRQRYQRQIKMGLLDEKYKLSPRDERVPSWESLSETQKDEADLKMAVYVAMVDRMDQGIGRVFAKIKEHGKWYEGGACSPFIASWPGVIKPGSITSQVGHIIDIVPTFMEMTGAVYPEQLNGRKLKSPAGKSLLPIFEGKQRKGHDVLFWQFSKAKAVRTGKWKLVRFGQADWELYDLEKDRTELNNLARKYPDKVRQMAAMWEDWWEKCKKKV